MLGPQPTAGVRGAAAVGNQSQDPTRALTSLGTPFGSPDPTLRGWVLMAPQSLQE